MSRKQRDRGGCAAGEQKDAGGKACCRKWCSSTRLMAGLAVAAACSLGYLLLLILSTYPSCTVEDTDNATFKHDRGVQEERPFEENGYGFGSELHATSLGRIVFGIAATARFWERRQNYVKLWWRPNEMRGFVWLDEPVSSWSSALPPYRISSNTSKFRYTHKGGRKAAIRISRVVSETYRVGLTDVDWFVMGDDDTMFVVDNLVKVLSKYDHMKFYYIGASSESHHQNLMFSSGMAYGGGGFAISYALASALEQHHDECLQRYPFLYGSDDRIHACMAELGVPLTREPGFHQFDVFGDVSGLLSAHPIAPFITMHHLDVINPIFPATSNQVSALRHLSKSVEIDPLGVFQQSMCYDKKRLWSISVSYGYLVKVFRGVKAPRDLETPTRTFMSWNRRYKEDGYSFTTRPSSKNACEVPVLFHMKETGYASASEGGDGWSTSNYTRTRIKKRLSDCNSGLQSPETLSWIYVVKERTDDLWFLAPRRQCCEVVDTVPHGLRLRVKDCKDGELII